MVAERLLDALLPETVPLPILSALPPIMAAAAINELANEENLFPTHIASMPPITEEVLGDVINQLSCKALTYGQVLMMVGGYIVKGVKLACGKRARAIRRSDGAFQMARPGTYRFAILDAPQPPTTPLGIGNQVLATLDAPGTPSPEPVEAPLHTTGEAGGDGATTSTTTSACTIGHCTTTAGTGAYTEVGAQPN